MKCYRCGHPFDPKAHECVEFNQDLVEPMRKRNLAILNAYHDKRLSAEHKARSKRVADAVKAARRPVG